ncbi:MAG: hypothetical protein HPY52_11225 [Firmicutes bacterium]|nr:hypothetical protein [Bacillota bacterium]
MRLPDKWKPIIIGALLGAVLMALVLGRYKIVGDAESVYKLDRLTGRVWWVLYDSMKEVEVR